MNFVQKYKPFFIYSISEKYNIDKLVIMQMFRKSTILTHNNTAALSIDLYASLEYLFYNGRKIYSFISMKNNKKSHSSVEHSSFFCLFEHLEKQWWNTYKHLHKNHLIGYQAKEKFKTEHNAHLNYYLLYSLNRFEWRYEFESILLWFVYTIHTQV